MAGNGSILVVGSINTDMVVRTSHLPEPGETVLGHSFTTTPGGKGANQAVAAARLGGNCTLIGRLGTDVFGRTIRSALITEGVNCQGITQTSAAATGIAMITVDADGENAIVVDAGANALANADDDIFSHEDFFEEADVVVVQLEIPTPAVQATLRMAKRHNCLTILDPAPVPEDRALPEELFNVDVITPNIIEACQLTGRKVGSAKGLRSIAGDLIARGVQAAVITLGHQGVLVATAAGDITRLHPYRIELENSTAAGDAFTGALAVGLAKGWDLIGAANFANAAGALACTEHGAMTSIPTLDAVRMLMSDQSP
jgi:ribokinase